MSHKEQFFALDKFCQQQCKTLAKLLERNSRYVALGKESSEKDEYAHYLRVRKLSLIYLLELKHLYSSLYCYHLKGDAVPYGHFRFIDQLTSGDHVCLMAGYIEYGDVKIPAVCKYYKSSKRGIDYEIQCYKRLAETGCEIPWMSSSYHLLGEKVMVIERLSEINDSDIPELLGIDILKQLQYLHTFGVHCDLKPGNIMVRRKGFECYVQDPKNCYKYMIIDHGGTATKKLGHGYRRFIWNPKFTSQTKGEPDQICTYINDLLELGYTINFLDQKRKGKKRFDHRREYINPRIKQYMDIVHSLQPKEAIPADIHLRLISVLQGK